MKEFWEQHKADIGLAVLVIYTLSLAVATADQIFELGLFPTKLDKMIKQSINRFESESESERKKAFKEITEYGDFAVPQLVEALDRDTRVRELAIKALQRITEQNLSGPEQWEEWYNKHKDDF